VRLEGNGRPYRHLSYTSSRASTQCQSWLLNFILGMQTEILQAGPEPPPMPMPIDIELGVGDVAAAVAAEVPIFMLIVPELPISILKSYFGGCRLRS